MIFSKQSIRCFFILLVLLVFFIDCAVDVSPVSANTITVNITYDEDVNNTDCSLREAVIAANTDAAYNGCTGGSGTDIISLSAGTYTVDSQLSDINTEIEINGADPTATIIQASGCNPTVESCTNDHQLVYVESPSGKLILNNLTLQYWKNTTGIEVDYGGAIFNKGTLNISNCIFYANQAKRGSAFYNFSTGTMTITNSTFLSNMAYYPSDYANGGAVYNYDGTLFIENSTFSGNKADYGGAIYNYGTEVIIKNSTFSGNSADTSGGGIINYGTATITNCTFSGNSATDGAGIYNGHTYILNFTNTIIANSVTGSDCSNISGTIVTNVNNLVEDGSCGATYSGDPSLGALADNGGPTQTIGLLFGSTAIDAGNLAACPATDQRGVSRPQGSGCDIGAFELIPAVADMTGSPTSGLASLEVDFTNNSTGDFSTCEWDFGDGNTSDNCDPSPHTYIDAGLFTVSLTVSGFGDPDTKTRGNYIHVIGPVIADFMGTPTSGVVPLEVDFTNNSMGDFNTCAWDFGDTITSNDCDPSSHMYTEIGVYTVSLTVSGLGGLDTKIREDYITVEELPSHESFLPFVVR
jgi:CSLREA domain-containing protein